MHEYWCRCRHGDSPHIGNGRRAHPTSGSPASRRSTRRRACVATAPKSAIIETRQFRTEAPTPDGLVLREPSGLTAGLTHWSFEQLAGIAGAPPKYLRTLPADLASSAINHGLQSAPTRRASCSSRIGPNRGPSTRSPLRGTRGSTTTSWRPVCSTSWPSTRPGSCHSATRTACMALNRFRPAPTWETETCSCSSWTATVTSTIPPTVRMPGCSAGSSSGTATSAPPPSPSICSCFAPCAGIT